MTAILAGLSSIGRREVPHTVRRACLEKLKGTNIIDSASPSTPHEGGTRLRMIEEVGDLHHLLAIGGGRCPLTLG